MLEKLVGHGVGWSRRGGGGAEFTDFGVAHNNGIEVKRRENIEQMFWAAGTCSRMFLFYANSMTGGMDIGCPSGIRFWNGISA